MKIEDVIKWCDDQSQIGKEVAICWEGGGDSGWVYMEVDGSESSSEEGDWLIDRMCDILDYGSWAGEFSASGRAVYDPETKVFEGEDIYSEDTNESYELSNEDIITIKIPKKYFLEELHVEFDNILDGGEITITPIVRNGILNQELVTYCKDLEAGILEKAVSLLSEHTSSEYSGWQSENFNKEDLYEASIDDPEMYVCKIATLEYMGYNSEERGIIVDLNEYAEIFNDQELS